MADGNSPPKLIADALEQPRKAHARRPTFCCGAYITHDSNGKPLNKPLRAQCDDDAMPGHGLCARCSGREIELRRMLAKRAEMAGQGESYQAPKRNKFGR